MGVDDGIIVARTDSLGAGLTKQIAYTRTKPGDIGDQYNAFLDCDDGGCCQGSRATAMSLISRDGKLCCGPRRLASNLFQFRPGTGEDRVRARLRSAALQNGADLLWIETEKPHIGQIAEHGRTASARSCRNAKLVYNNSPSASTGL